MTIEQIEIMKAYDEGKHIQSRAWGGSVWVDEEKPEWNWDECEYRINPVDLTPTYIYSSNMYNKFVCINNGLEVLRIADIVYISFDDARNDVIIHLKNGDHIYEPKNITFYNENGEQFTINTAFEDEKRVKKECARVNAQFLIRLISLEK